MKYTIMFVIIGLIASFSVKASDSPKDVVMQNSSKLEVFADVSSDCKIQLKVRGKKGFQEPSCKSFMGMFEDMIPILALVMENRHDSDFLEDPTIRNDLVNAVKSLKNIKYIEQYMTI